MYQYKKKLIFLLVLNHRLHKYIIVFTMTDFYNDRMIENLLKNRQTRFCRSCLCFPKPGEQCRCKRKVKTVVKKKKVWSRVRRKGKKGVWVKTTKTVQRWETRMSSNRTQRDDMKYEYMCPVCDEVFDTQQGLSVHKTKMHQKKLDMLSFLVNRMKTIENKLIAAGELSDPDEGEAEYVF